MSTPLLSRRSMTALAAAAAVAGLVASGAAVTGASHAAAPAITKTLNYSCNIPVLGATTLPVTLGMTPDALPANGATFNTAVSVNVAVPANVTGSLGLVGATNADLNAALHTTWTGPITGTYDGVLPQTNSVAPAQGVWNISGAAQYPALTPNGTGEAVLTANGMDVVLTLKNAQGQATALGTANMACTLVAGQDPVITKLNIA